MVLQPSLLVPAARGGGGWAMITAARVAPTLSAALEAIASSSSLRPLVRSHDASYSEPLRGRRRRSLPRAPVTPQEGLPPLELHNLYEDALAAPEVHFEEQLPVGPHHEARGLPRNRRGLLALDRDVDDGQRSPLPRQEDPEEEFRGRGLSLAVPVPAVGTQDSGLCEATRSARGQSSRRVILLTGC